MNINETVKTLQKTTASHKQLLYISLALSAGAFILSLVTLLK